MTHVFHRDPRIALPRIAGGSGIHLWDQSGRRYIDASGGAAVSCLGHGHPDILAAMREQAQKIAYAHSSFFTSDAAEQLADALIEASPPSFSQVYFVSGGSEAVEAALKLARQYFLEIGEPKRSRFIARRQSYHGNTLGALAVGGNAWRRAPFEPLLVEVSHVSPCFAYRFKAADESDTQYVDRLAAELEAEILRLGPENVAGFIAETLVGATSGAVPPVAGYFRRVREICDRYGLLLILDEVMCGIGRTGSFHAFAQEGIEPDLVAVAKGLAGGYQPIGAVIVTRRIYDAILAGSGYFQHGHTYMAHPMACAAALAVQRVIHRDKLINAAERQGARLASRLQGRFGNHPHVGDIRGRGLFQAIELVADRGTGASFDPAVRLHARVKAEAMKLDLLVYPMGGTIDGKHGDHVLLAPPYIVTEGELDTIIERLGDAVDRAVAALGIG